MLALAVEASSNFGTSAKLAAQLPKALNVPPKDMIVTQLFYDTRKFNAFVEKARAMGIAVPIIPGIMPIQSYAGFKRMTAFCKTFVPEEISGFEKGPLDTNMEPNCRIWRIFAMKECPGAPGVRFQPG